MNKRVERCINCDWVGEPREMHKRILTEEEWEDENDQRANLRVMNQSGPGTRPIPRDEMVRSCPRCDSVDVETVNIQMDGTFEEYQEMNEPRIRKF